MAIEDVVEGWFDEYEQRRSSSMLHKLVGSSITLTSAQSGDEATWQQLLDATSLLMTKRQNPRKLILDYLQWRLPLLHKVLIYPELTLDLIVDELEIMLYAAGWLPRLVNGERVYVKGDGQIELMSLSSAKLHTYKKYENEREDSRFYRLVMRVSQRHYRDVRNHARIVKPGWSGLVAQVLKFQPLQHLDFTEYYAEEVKAENRFNEVILAGLKQYMIGVRAVQTAQGQVYVEPLRNLNLLGRPKIERGVDVNLRSFFRSVRRAEKKGGPTWGDYLDHVGAFDDVTAFHYGIAPNRNIIAGHPTEQDDYAFLKLFTLGIAPVTYKGKTKLAEKAEDLHVLIGFRNDFRIPEWCPEELTLLFRRAQSRFEQEKGMTPAQLLNAVLADKEVAAKYGNMAAQDIYITWAVHQLKEFLRPRVVGELSLTSNGNSVRITPGENLHLLMPRSKFGDPELRRFNSQLKWYQATRGIGYWDVVEQVLGEPAAVSYHGRAMIRQDINPLIQKVATVA